MLKEVMTYLIIIIFVLLIKQFVLMPVIVDGSSMEPTLKDNEVLMLNKLDKKIKRFDIVVLKEGDSLLIKRVIGLPNEEVSYINNKLYINNVLTEDIIKSYTSDFTFKDIQIYNLKDNEYFVLGDNRPHSADSRLFGLVSKKDILGITKLRLFPFDKFGMVK